MAIVMVIDDETMLLDMVASLIEDLGHTPLTATNGQEALHILAQQDEVPKLIISDIMMPRMNGIEMVKVLRSSHQWHDIPVALMSAAGRPRVEHLADQFIHKPFDLDAILQLIDRYIG